VLYTPNNISIIAPEQVAQRLSLFEPYEMSGQVKIFPGGQYLKLDRAELFDPSGYRHVIG
jgi:hypothetical protein